MSVPAPVGSSKLQDLLPCTVTSSGTASSTPALWIEHERTGNGDALPLPSGKRRVGQNRLRKATIIAWTFFARCFTRQGHRNLKRLLD